MEKREIKMESAANGEGIHLDSEEFPHVPKELQDKNFLLDSDSEFSASLSTDKKYGSDVETKDDGVSSVDVDKLIQSAVNEVVSTSTASTIISTRRKRAFLTITSENDTSIGPAPSASKVRRTSELEKDVLSRTTGLHTPSINRRKDGKDHRKRCRVCKTKKTDLICYECNVPLCISSHGMENCWYIFHNCESITKPTQEPKSTNID